MDIVLHSDLRIEKGILVDDVVLESNWRYNQENLNNYALNSELYITQDLYIRRIVKEPRHKTLKDLLLRLGNNDNANYLDFDINHLFKDGWGTNEDAEEELRKLFGNTSPMDYPKPVKLIKKLIASMRDRNSIIIDFFAGSGTTAHAVMDLNKEDGGNRKYILVQLPEATDEKSEAYKAGYTKISDITKERIKRAMQKLEYKEGFKSFYLDTSNFQIFKEVKKRPDMSYEEIEKMLKMSMFHENILTQGAKELDIVYEVGLKNGFTLSAEVEEIKTDQYSFITLSEEERVFYFSFDKKIEGDIVHHVPKDAKLICYEKALTTNVKLNLRENLDLEVL